MKQWERREWKKDAKALQPILRMYGFKERAARLSKLSGEALAEEVGECQLLIMSRKADIRRKLEAQRAERESAQGD